MTSFLIKGIVLLKGFEDLYDKNFLHGLVESFQNVVMKVRALKVLIKSGGGWEEGTKTYWKTIFEQ